MTVKELKELLSNVPDDLKVMVMMENHLKPGMFAFAEACSCDTGVSELGTAEDGTGGGESVFLVLPHGSGVPEDEIDNEENKSPALNMITSSPAASD
jgi:hypothetical protein